MPASEGNDRRAGEPVVRPWDGPFVPSRKGSDEGDRAMGVKRGLRSAAFTAVIAALLATVVVVAPPSVSAAGQADLAISVVTAPSDVSTGDTVTLRFRIDNRGD